jgi:hypothetical protein
VRLVGDSDEIWEIIIIGVRVVYEPAFTNQEFARVYGGGAAREPSAWPVATGFADGVDGSTEMVRFFLNRQPPQLLPPEAVTAGLVVRFADIRRNLRIQFSSDRG